MAMAEEKESLGWKLFIQEGEKRIAALEAEAREISQQVDTYVEKRKKVRRMFGFLLKSS